MRHQNAIDSNEDISDNIFVHSLHKPTVILDAEQIASFHRDGFVVVPQISTPAEIAWLWPLFEKLFATRVGRAEGAHYDLISHDEDNEESSLPSIIMPVYFVPELLYTQFRVNALAIAQQLLGPAVTPSFEHAILKPARSGGATPWHQDEAYRVDPDFEYQQISIWMPLQNTTQENGCMQYIPGTNRGDVLPHRSPQNDTKVHAIECAADFDPSDARACPINAGGATIHHGRTLHYAGPNRSDEPRCAYILAFEIPPKPLKAHRDFYWNREKQTANLARKQRWRRHGGIVVEALRKLRLGMWRSPARMLFELRRGWRALMHKQL